MKQNKVNYVHGKCETRFKAILFSPKKGRKKEEEKSLFFFETNMGFTACSRPFPAWTRLVIFLRAVNEKKKTKLNYVYIYKK